MRRLFNGMAVMAVVLSLAGSAEARSRDHERGQQGKPSIVQLLKQWVVSAFGDGLIVPRP